MLLLVFHIPLITTSIPHLSYLFTNKMIIQLSEVHSSLVTLLYFVLYIHIYMYKSFHATSQFVHNYLILLVPNIIIFS